MNPRPPESVCETIYDFSNLKVLTPPLDYIAGMKLFSGRGQDIEDVAAILKELSIEDPERFRQTLAGYGFAAVDESLLLEAFGLAYGMEWLEQYYIEHEEDIINRTRGSSS